MPIYPPTGGVIPWTEEQVAEWEVESRGIRDGSHPTEVWQIDATSWTCKFFCKYEHRFDFISYLLGESAVATVSGVQTLSRTPPYTIPGFPRIGCTKVLSVKGHKFLHDAAEIEGDLDVGILPMPIYKEAEIEAYFEFLPFKISADGVEEGEFPEMARWVIHPDESEPAGEFLKLPVNSGMCYLDIPADANKPIKDNQFAVQSPHETFHVQWLYLPEDAVKPGSAWWQRIFGTSEWVGGDDIPYMGCINSHTLFNRPPGTVLFNRPKLKRRSDWKGGQVLYDVTFEFTYKPQGWNYLYNWSNVVAKRGWYFVGPSGGVVQPSDDLDDNYSLYNARDLRYLFRIDDA